MSRKRQSTLCTFSTALIENDLYNTTKHSDQPTVRHICRNYSTTTSVSILYALHLKVFWQLFDIGLDATSCSAVTTWSFRPFDIRDWQS